MKRFTKIIAAVTIIAGLLLSSCVVEPIDKSIAPTADLAQTVQPGAQNKFFDRCVGGVAKLVLDKKADGNCLSITITGISNESYVTVRVFDTASGAMQDYYMGINDVHNFSITEGTMYYVHIISNIDTNVSGYVNIF